EEIAKEIAEHQKQEDAHGGIHMPFQSIWPIIAASGILVGALGLAVISHDPRPGFWGIKIGVSILGGLILFFGAYMWSLEGNEGYHLHPPPEDPEAHSRPPMQKH